MSNQLRTQFGLHLGGTFSAEGATKKPPTRENHLKEKWEGKEREFAVDVQFNTPWRLSTTLRCLRQNPALASHLPLLLCLDAQYLQLGCRRRNQAVSSKSSVQVSIKQSIGGG